MNDLAVKECILGMEFIHWHEDSVHCDLGGSGDNDSIGKMSAYIGTTKKRRGGKGDDEDAR
jgi:hypothetical protein